MTAYLRIPLWALSATVAVLALLLGVIEIRRGDAPGALIDGFISGLNVAFGFANSKWARRG